MPYLNFLVYLLVSGLTLGLIYLKAPITLLQQFSALLLAILVFLFSKFNTKSGFKISTGYKLIFLFTSSLFTQLLVIATGGIYSPFLILLHLFTLASSLLLTLSSSISFLLLSMLILAANLYLNPSLYKIFQDDPGSAILYFVSFLVVIPLAHLLIHTYNLKDRLLNLLRTEVSLSRQRTESVFKGVNELVVVCDKNLKIISANEAILKALYLPEEALLGKQILTSLPIVDQNNQPPSSSSLSIDQTINDQTTRIIKGFSLLEKAGSKSIPVGIQIRPIMGQDMKVNQIMFVISEAYTAEDTTHSDLDKAKAKNSQILASIKQNIINARLNKTQEELEYFLKAEDDILNATELEDHPIKQKQGFVDVAFLSKEIVESKKLLAASVNVDLNFNLDKKEVSESALLEYQDQKVDFKVADTSPFATTIDSKWLSILIQKLIEIAILCSDPHSTVNMFVRRDENFSIVNITANAQRLINTNPDQLFQPYYPKIISQTNLNLGSGLEGYIAKIILFEMGLKLIKTISPNLPNLIFELYIPKNPVFEA